jgi:hypothetical protein
MSTAEEPDGHEHVRDEYVTYSRCKERRSRPNFPPFPPSSKEEKEAHREAETTAKREAEHEADEISLIRLIKIFATILLL